MSLLNKLVLVCMAALLIFSGYGFLKINQAERACQSEVKTFHGYLEGVQAGDSLLPGVASWQLNFGGDERTYLVQSLPGVTKQLAEQMMPGAVWGVSYVEMGTQQGLVVGLSQGTNTLIEPTSFIQAIDKIHTATAVVWYLLLVVGLLWWVNSRGRSRKAQIPDQEAIFYKCSGHLSIVGFLAVLPIFFLSAIFAGYLMNQLLAAGHFVLFLTPAFSALLLIVLWLFLLRVAHCRNRALGVVLMGLCGCLTLSAYFYFGMIGPDGYGPDTQLTALPNYIGERMAYEVTYDTKDGIESAGEPNPLLNWLMLCFDVGLLTLIPIGVGITFFKHPYCEYCGRWHKLKTKLVMPGLGQVFLKVVKDSSIRRLIPVEKARLELNSHRDVVGLYHCPKCINEPSEGFISAYFTVRSVKRVALFGNMYQWGKSLLVSRRLRRREFDGLNLWFTDHYDQLRRVSEQVDQVDLFIDPAVSVDSTRPMTTSAIGSTSRGSASKLNLKKEFTMRQVVTIQPVQDELRGRILKRLQRFKRNSLKNLLSDGILSEEAYLKQIEKGFAGRTDLLIRPGQKGVSVAEYVPKANWGKRKGLAEDVGLIYFDYELKEMYFEGDQERYQIPRGAIQEVMVKSLPFDRTGKKNIYVVVMEVMIDEGVAEMPLLPNGLTRESIGMAGQAQAEVLRADILDFRNGTGNKADFQIGMVNH